MSTQRRAVQGSAGGGGGGVSSLHAIAPNHNGWTEADIRRWLDGTFTRMDWFKNCAVTIEVAEDYIPRHIDGRTDVRVEQERWTADEDTALLKLMRQGVRRKADLAIELDRSEESIASRLRRLRKARRA